MCGFLAWFHISNSAEDQKSLFLKSLDYQKKRGPDSSNLHIGKNYILGHNRLAIIDQNSRSNQPFTKDKKNFLLYNGELYNVEKLKYILSSHSIKLITESDTEILYEILINFGIKKTLSLIEGMFSFVYYDSLKKEVFAAKDKFGQKPLFFYRYGEELIISSSIASIRNLKPNIRVDKDSIFTYLFTQGHIEPAKTFFENIHSLEAGHFILFRKNRNIIERYFAVENIVGNKYQKFSEEDLILEGSKILSKSVKEHLNADCKVGNLLSGGIDSTLIKYFIEENLRNHTSFMKYSDDIENIPNVYLKSNLDKTSRILITYPSKKKYLERLFEYISFGGRPAPWGGGPPMMDLCERAHKNNFKVLLSGDCVDEFSAGYLPSVKSLQNFKCNFDQPDHLCSLKYLTKDSSFGYYQENLRRRIINNIEKSNNKLLDYFRINSCQNIEFHLQETNLPHSDTFSMSQSIELRNPYLSPDFVEFFLNLNIENVFNYWNNKEKTGKYILKKIAQEKYALNFDNNYFLNKEGTRNYSLYISNTDFWKISKFKSLDFLNGYSIKFNDWKVIFNLINLEIFLNIFNHQNSKLSLLESVMTDKGKINLLNN